MEGKKKKTSRGFRHQTEPIKKQQDGSCVTVTSTYNHDTHATINKSDDLRRRRRPDEDESIRREVVPNLRPFIQARRRRREAAHLAIDISLVFGRQG